MTPIPYKLEAYRSANDGRFYGKLWYGGSVVADAKEDVDNGFRKHTDIEQWARMEAVNHKHSISPSETHTLETTFVV